MAVVQTLIGNVKGPKGDTGATGAQGVQGDAATINVGSVSTTAYGNPAQVVNVGTESEAVLNFVIPQGKPGQATTTMGGLTLDTITTSTASFPSPQVGDTGATAFGKIVKWFADGLAAITAKLDAANVVNNLTTTEAGYALDARQGKALNDSLTSVSTSLTEKLPTSSLVWLEAKSAITLSSNQTVSFDYYGYGIFEISANSSSGHYAAAYLRDTTTNAYVAAIGGVDAAGQQISIGFPIMSGRSYKLTYSDYTSSVRIWPFKLRISAA